MAREVPYADFLDGRLEQPEAVQAPELKVFPAVAEQTHETVAVILQFPHRSEEEVLAHDEEAIVANVHDEEIFA